MGDVKEDEINVPDLIRQASEYQQHQQEQHHQKILDLFELSNTKEDAFSLKSFNSEHYCLENINDQLENMNIAIEQLTDVVDIEFKKLNHQIKKLSNHIKELERKNGCE